MTLFGLFGKKQDPLLRQAENLVNAARVNAVGIFPPLFERYPMLRQVETEQWGYVLTVAAVFMAASRLSNLHLADEREGQLMDIVCGRLDEWNPDGLRGFDNCKELFETEYARLEATGHDAQFLASDAVGIWIVLNVLGHLPKAPDEVALVRMAGASVTHSMFDWWDT